MQQGKLKLNMNIPAELHIMLRKLAIEKRLTATAIIVQYLQYLQAQHYKQRDALNENSPKTFKLDDGKPR